MNARLGELEERVARLEELLRGYRKALEDDPKMAEQTAQMLRIVRNNLGASQRGICQAAAREFGISRGRALEILRRETGVLWQTIDGAFNSKLYFERERNTLGTELTHESGTEADAPVCY